MAICVFVTTLKVEQTKPSIWSQLGEHYSLYIYVFHLAWLELSRMFIPEIWKQGAFICVAPGVILLLTIGTIYALRRLRILR